MTIGTMSRRCRAHNRHGEPCAAAPIHGGNVCVAHGGRAPQVRLSATQRLAGFVEPILSEMYRLAVSAESEAVRVQAAKDLLDRAGLKPPERIEAAVLGQFTLRIDRGDRES